MALHILLCLLPDKLRLCGVKLCTTDYTVTDRMGSPVELSWLFFIWFISVLTHLCVIGWDRVSQVCACCVLEYANSHFWGSDSIVSFSCKGIVGAYILHLVLALSLPFFISFLTIGWPLEVDRCKTSQVLHVRYLGSYFFAGWNARWTCVGVLYQLSVSRWAVCSWMAPWKSMMALVEFRLFSLTPGVH